MKHLLILLLLLSTNAFAQGPFGEYAVVKDKDGYVNIRAKENVKSKIIGTLPENTLVYVFFEEEYNPTNWIEVDKGYVHKSRLKKVEDFHHIKPSRKEDNSISFSEMGIQINIASQPFDKNKHTIVKKKKEGYSQYIIDGKVAQGIDDFLPNKEYKTFEVIINGKQVQIPKSAYSDIYEIWLYKGDSQDNCYVYYDKEDDILYIIAHNGDGANVYEVCWQIVKGKYITRIIGEPL